MSARKLAGSALAVGAITALTVLLGLARNVVTADAFGASRDMDAYLIAAIIPNFLLYLFGIDILRGVATTLFSGSLAVGDEHERQRLFSSLLNTVLVVSGIASLLTAVAMPWIVRAVAAGFSPADQRLTAYLAYIMLPTAVFIGVGSYLAAVLNAYRRFALPATLRMGPHLAVIAAILLLARSWGVFSIAAGMVVGSALGALIQLVFCLRVGLRWRLALDIRHPLVKKAALLALPVLLMTAMGQFGQLLQRFLGSYLSGGKISALNYALMLASLAIRMGLEPLGTVLLPELSAEAAREQTAKLAQWIRRGLVANLLLMVPVTVLMLVLATDLVRIVYQRGRFDAGDTQLTAAALRVYVAPLVLWGTWLLLVRVYIAVHDTARAVKLSVVGYLILYGGSAVLVRPLDFLGLAVAQALQHGVFALMLWFDLKRRVARIVTPALTKAATWGLAASAGMLAAMLPLRGLRTTAGSDLLQAVTHAAVVAGAGLVAYGLVLAVPYRREAIRLLGRLRGRQ